MAANPSTASPSSSLQGKVAIITGGSKGIGKASAIALARLGANVVINYSSDEEAAQGVIAEIQKLGAGEARLVRADASTVDGVQSLVKQTVDVYSKIDVLIPNAGLLPMKDLEHTTEADFDRTFALNVKGPYFLAQVKFPNPLGRETLGIGWPDL
jgi:3-oxoacyl-[acyl-carrier protein] reductase